MCISDLENYFLVFGMVRVLYFFKGWRNSFRVIDGSV